MAFKNVPPPSSVPDSPEKLILDLPRRKIRGALLHQGEVMRAYRETAIDKADVALQLPTGSGKTLVGLMIAEWRRRKFDERVVYLCPTNQLVNQVVEQANEVYGLSVIGFTGEKSKYEPSNKAKYKANSNIAVTNYSSLFNSNPYFDDADLVIVDDAHAVEGYIASMWTISITKAGGDAPLFTAFANLLHPHIGTGDFARMTTRISGVADAAWVDKIPTPKFLELIPSVQALLDAHCDLKSVKFSWPYLRDHLFACQLYISSKEILLRPLIPPTWTHAPFGSPRQRIFMSATFGKGGDVERLTGRANIHAIPVPSGWDTQGIGRRFFMFPEMSLDTGDAKVFRNELMQRAGRSLVLVPSDPAANEIKEDIQKGLGFPVFEAGDIESSKAGFVQSSKAVAVIANRYDGIDFPGDDCRLSFIEGLPKATNIQERFLMSRMGANALYQERIQTRVLQAVGRCTRSLDDYSAVIVSGEDLPNYFADKNRRRYLHPEMQAEIDFGIAQSQDSNIPNLIENFEIFQKYDTEWENANSQILALRDSAIQHPLPAIEELGTAVGHEIKYQKAIWNSDFLLALEEAERVLASLTASELRGYRALWHYLAGSAATMAKEKEGDRFHLKAKSQFEAAKKAALSLPWLVGLSRISGLSTEEDEKKVLVDKQIEGIESVLEKLGFIHNREFDLLERSILDGLSSPAGFEAAHVKLGETLGFMAGKRETDASPDPWWCIDRLCFVFEDHAGAIETSRLDATKARQVATHPNWIRANVPECADAEIIPVLVTPVRCAEPGAMPHLNAVGLWSLQDFRAWAEESLRILRFMRVSFREPGDLVWRAEAADALIANDMTAEALKTRFQQNIAARILRQA